MCTSNSNIKLFRERDKDRFPTYSVLECNVIDKVIVKGHTRDVWDPK